MDIHEYIEERLDPQIKWYDEKSISCQKSYKLIQIVEIILAATIPLLSGYCNIFLISIIVGILGIIITILESLAKLFKYHENWIQYRTTCELLKYQKYIFLTGASPYNKADETVENIFVKNIEQIISSENNQWKSTHIKINRSSDERKD
ncbi:DUF4231 domain-containing protein [Porcipelethomonas sp.]|uniref:DUF4231 domain-containing protein n=1 Tax=Porcipelethomonas sp. TaxID=2981675 RepID=UPI003EF96F11